MNKTHEVRLREWRREKNGYSKGWRYTKSKKAQSSFSIVGRQTIGIEMSEDRNIAILFRNIELHMRKNIYESVEIRSSLGNRDWGMGMVGQ